MNLPVRAIREQVASAVSVIVQQQRYADGTRRVSAISEVRGIDGESIELRDVFRFVQEGFDAEGHVVGRFVATGLVPAFYGELQQRGVPVDLEVFQGA
jgi:pilus assembly protein CpaF